MTFLVRAFATYLAQDLAAGERTRITPAAPEEKVWVISLLRCELRFCVLRLPAFFCRRPSLIFLSNFLLPWLQHTRSSPVMLEFPRRRGRHRTSRRGNDVHAWRSGLWRSLHLQIREERA